MECYELLNNILLTWISFQTFICLKVAAFPLIGCPEQMLQIDYEWIQVNLTPCLINSRICPVFVCFCDLFNWILILQSRVHPMTAFIWHSWCMMGYKLVSKVSLKNEIISKNVSPFAKQGLENWTNCLPFCLWAPSETKKYLKGIRGPLHISVTVTAVVHFYVNLVSPCGTSSN